MASLVACESVQVYFELTCLFAPLPEGVRWSPSLCPLEALCWVEGEPVCLSSVPPSADLSSGSSLILLGWRFPTLVPVSLLLQRLLLLRSVSCRLRHLRPLCPDLLSLSPVLSSAPSPPPSSPCTFPASLAGPGSARQPHGGLGEPLHLCRVPDLDP